MYHVILRMRCAMQILSIRRFWDPLNIFEMVKDRNFIFSGHILHNKYWHDKLPPKVGLSGSRDINLKFGTLHNFWAEKVTRSKFCTLTQYMKLCLQMKILPLNGRDLGHVTVLKFWDPLCIFGTVKDRNSITLAVAVALTVTPTPTLTSLSLSLSVSLSLSPSRTVSEICHMYMLEMISEIADSGGRKVGK